jgi:hypothetical protein
MVVFPSLTHVLDVGNNDRLQTVGHHVLGLLVRSVSDLGHGGLTREPSSNSVINTCDVRECDHRRSVHAVVARRDDFDPRRTLRLSPSLLDSMVSVGLMPLEDLGSLLDDGDGGGHFCDRKRDAVRPSFLNSTCFEPPQASGFE